MSARAWKFGWRLQIWSMTSKPRNMCWEKACFVPIACKSPRANHQWTHLSSWTHPKFCSLVERDSESRVISDQCSYPPFSRGWGNPPICWTLACPRPTQDTWTCQGCAQQSSQSRANQPQDLDCRWVAAQAGSDGAPGKDTRATDEGVWSGGQDNRGGSAGAAQASGVVDAGVQIRARNHHQALKHEPGVSFRPPPPWPSSGPLKCEPEASFRPSSRTCHLANPHSHVNWCVHCVREVVWDLQATRTYTHRCFHGVPHRTSKNLMILLFVECVELDIDFFDYHNLLECRAAHRFHSSSPNADIFLAWDGLQAI